MAAKRKTPARKRAKKTGTAPVDGRPAPVEPTAELLPPGDKRGAERVALAGGLGGAIKVFQPLVVSEISRFGATIETAALLQLDSLHEIRLTLGDRSVVVNGRVAHAHISGVNQGVVTYKAGIEFVEPSPGAEAVIAGFVDRLKASEGRPE